MIKKYLNNSNWNIGFVDNFTSVDLIRNKRLPHIKWMQHPYKDRAFADPHILCCNSNELIILCEELVFGHKGSISLLKISRNDYRLLDRKELLKLSTHLSYPAIIEYNGIIYVYPENSEVGNIKYYEFDLKNLNLIEIGIIVNGEVTDFTICKKKIGGKYWALSTTLHPDSEERAYLFSSDRILGPYTMVTKSPVTTDRSCSRPGGNFFEVDSVIYRPAQDCVGHYGKGLKIMKIESFNPYIECEQFELKPSSFKYNLGLHTLNFKGNITVIDGYGYLYPVIGRILSPINRLRLKLKVSHNNIFKRILSELSCL